MKNQK